MTDDKSTEHGSPPPNIRLRICHVGPLPGSFGGVAGVINGLARAQTRDHDVALVGSRVKGVWAEATRGFTSDDEFPLSHYLGATEAQVVEVPDAGWTRFSSIINGLRQHSAVGCMVLPGGGPIDIVHHHAPVMMGLSRGSGPLLSLPRGISRVVTLHGVAHLEVGPGAKVNDEAEGDAGASYGGSGVVAATVRGLEGYGLAGADAITTPGRTTRSVALSHEGVPEEKVHVVPNGVDTDVFLPRSATPSDGAPSRGIDVQRLFGLPEATPFVLVMAALNRFHDPTPLLKAVASLPERDRPAVVMLGDGPLVPVMKEVALGLGIEEMVRIPGAVPNHLLPSIIPEASMVFQTLVHPGLDVRGRSMGFGRAFSENEEVCSNLSLLEAMSCARPVIATSGCCSGMVHEDDPAGFLLHPGDETGIAGVITSLLQDPELGVDVGGRAREMVVEHRDWSVIARRVEDVYNSILQRS